MGPRINTDINISPPAVTEFFDAVEIMLQDTHFRVMLFLIHVFSFCGGGPVCIRHAGRGPRALGRPHMWQTAVIFRGKDGEEHEKDAVSEAVFKRTHTANVVEIVRR